MHHEPSFRPLSRSIPLSAVIGLLLVSLFATPSLQAQEEETLIKVFRLQRINVNVAKEVVANVCNDGFLRVSTDPDQNSLIVCGPKATLQKVEETLQTLDQPAPVQESKSVVFYIAHVPAEELLQSLNMILKAQPIDGVHMVANKPTNSIIVSAKTEESIDFIKSKIELIDQPTPGNEKQQSQLCEIRVTWLIETKDLGKNGENTRPMPKSLEKLGKRLIDRHGFQELRTITSFATTVSPRQPGDVVASFSGSSHSSGSAGPELKAEGEIQMSDDDSGRFEIHLRAAMKQTNYGTEISPESSLIIPANHPVALCVADTEKLRSVLVLEIEELE